MPSFLLRFFRRLAAAVSRKSALTENGERVDIDLTRPPRYALMDIYQKSHYKRYLFAKQYVRPGMACGDFACGSGYGSVLLAEVASKVTAIDIKQNIIDAVSARYAAIANVEFVCRNLRMLAYDHAFDLIVSFETIEHLAEQDILATLGRFCRALKRGGMLIFSTPYLQKKTDEAVAMGFHLTFDIDEAKIASWLERTGFVAQEWFYQNYKTHEVLGLLEPKDFVICIAKKSEFTA